MARILVVDDDIESVRLIGLLLQRRGYEIIAAQSGAQALEKSQTQHPDLVLLDIMMPEMDGYEVCRRLRANPGTADLPVIMFTAKRTVHDKVTGFEAGADDFLTKPIHPKELASRVEAVLLRSRRTPAVQRPVKQAHTIGFLGAKGGVGTTTLAVNTAVALAQGPAEEKRTILVEMRSGMAVAPLQMGIRHHGGILRLLEHPADQIRTQMVEAQLAEHGTGVLLLSGQITPLGVTTHISPDHADAIALHLSAVADYLLLDLGVGMDETNRRLLPQCDHIVITIEPNRVTLTLAQALLDEIGQSLPIPSHTISVVMVNKNRSTTTFSRDMVEGLLGHNFGGVIPAAPELAFQSAEQGIPMVMLQPNSLAAQQFQTIAANLIEA